MASDLAIRTASSAVGAPRSSQPASSLSTEGLEFNEPALGWADLSAAALKLASDAGMVGEAVVQLPGASRRADGRLTQERLGYRAYADRVIVVHAERPLTRRPDGKLAPSGPWAMISNETRTASTPPVRRTGTVSPGVLQQAASGATGTGPLPSRAHATGVDAEAYLPSSVRAGLAKAVGTPVVHTGAFLLWTHPHGGEQAVDVLRFQLDRAVVVHAVRPDRPDADWSVTQLTYDLQTQHLRLGR